ncbi:caltractin-like isoform X1 [Dinothrombium tinctorium]|uniref:Caltractin-like isoform X1 n=1 Tax=Dinothrombium tinctorium TaxID=1965070 RepID=A0A3S3PE69_9ACAR|nr:caltractin-like isoform X1 [Dinothrombium tinctorium]RWR99044.1 caltractin-like isoform X1 [Dinothrombium tinctorium]
MVSKASKNELSEETQQDIREAFAMFDTNNEGFMPTAKLKFAMRALGFEPRKEEVKKIIEEFDNEASGKISLQSFMALMSKKISEKDTNDEIMKAFKLFDEDNTGKISFNNLKNVAKQLGENISDEELKEMIEEADRDGDGFVNQEEFLRIMKKTCLY